MKTIINKGDIVTCYCTKKNEFYKVISGNNYSNYKDFEKSECLKLFHVAYVERPIMYELVFDLRKLDHIERNYLTNVIRPFKKDIKYIRKARLQNGDYCLIVKLNNTDGMIFPSFNDSSMYQGMEIDKEYTLEELGL